MPLDKSLDFKMRSSEVTFACLRGLKSILVPSGSFAVA